MIEIREPNKDRIKDLNSIKAYKMYTKHMAESGSMILLRNDIDWKLDNLNNCTFIEKQVMKETLTEKNKKQWSMINEIYEERPRRWRNSRIKKEEILISIVIEIRKQSTRYL